MPNHGVRFPISPLLLMGALVLIIAACTGASATPTLAPESDSATDQPVSTFAFTREELVLRMVTAGLRDGIQAILDPHFVPSEDVPSIFGDEEQVIGVSINGDARAYPIDILSHREIVNDVVGGKPIAVTW